MAPVVTFAEFVVVVIRVSLHMKQQQRRELDHKAKPFPSPVLTEQVQRVGWNYATPLSFKLPEGGEALSF